jgi:hypothetical protein
MCAALRITTAAAAECVVHASMNLAHAVHLLASYRLLVTRPVYTAVWLLLNIVYYSPDQGLSVPLAASVQLLAAFVTLLLHLQTHVSVKCTNYKPVHTTVSVLLHKRYSSQASSSTAEAACSDSAPLLPAMLR